MRAYKTVNDAYIEPISFTVPRRAETFQADIFPPAIGNKPAMSAEEWLDGKTNVPAKIDLESVYEGVAPKEVASDYKAPAKVEQVPVSKPTPKVEQPKHEQPQPAAAVRSPPPSMNEQKGSIAAMANKYADNEPEEEEEDDASSFEEISKPTRAPTQPTQKSEPKPAVTPAPAAAPVKASTPLRAPVQTTAAASSAAPSSTNGNETSLDQIKQLIEGQTKLINAQNETISKLSQEVQNLKVAVGSAGSRDQSERIRQLELELEEARS